MAKPTEGEKRFVAHLQGLVEREDRAALAALRRGLGKRPGNAAEMHPYVVPRLSRYLKPWEEDAYYLVASLFAHHQSNWEPGEGAHPPTNLGASFARLTKEGGSGSTEGRFVALLNAHREDLPDHLRRVVGLLKAKRVPVDWAQLLRDLHRWDLEGQQVQRDWARAFWAEETGESEETLNEAREENASVS